jgi:hypothetical protein
MHPIHPFRSRTARALLAACFGLLCAGPAVAGVFDPTSSTLRFQYRGIQLPEIAGTSGGGGSATLSSGGGSSLTLNEQAGIWQALGVTPGSSLFTGLPLITNLTVNVANQSGTYTDDFGNFATKPNPFNPSAAFGYICTFGCLGGTGGISGTTVVSVAGAQIPLSNDVVGRGGTTDFVLAPGATVRMTGGPFVTGAVRMTGISTPRISIVDRSVRGAAITLEPTSMERVRILTTFGGDLTTNPSGQVSILNAVTLSGSRDLTPMGDVGTVTLVSPVRIDFGPIGLGTVPGKYVKRFVFVPEPTVGAGLLAGVLALCAMGRRRRRGRAERDEG